MSQNRQNKITISHILNISNKNKCYRSISVLSLASVQYIYIYNIYIKYLLHNYHPHERLFKRSLAFTDRLSSFIRLINNFSINDRFKMKCCSARKLKTCGCYTTDPLNHFQGLLDYTVPNGEVLKGLYSYHRNDKEYVWYCLLACILSLTLTLTLNTNQLYSTFYSISIASTDKSLITSTPIQFSKCKVVYSNHILFGGERFFLARNS